MNVYDTVNKLAQEIKNSNEYLEFKKIKEEINSNVELKEKIKEFEKNRYQVQMMAMQTGKPDEQMYKKIQEDFAELVKNESVNKYFDAELKFNVILADVNKIIGEAVRDVIEM
ncbi:MAG: YlbF family regulator [Clostridia bacterium]|nr:YlbF family regulator [Clostridia bacterium]